MVIADWIIIIKGVLAFPAAILKVVKLLQATPEQQHMKVIEKIQNDFDEMAKTGRPVWDE